MSRIGWVGAVLAILSTPAPGAIPHRPYVVDSHPKDGQTAVDPARKSITVQFSREMSTRSDGWVGHAPTYPTVTGRAVWSQDRLRCSLPVALSPGRCYVVGVNDAGQTGFRGRNRTGALPYVIVFATSGFDTQATPLPFAWVKSVAPPRGASAVRPGRHTLDIHLSRAVKGGAGPWKPYGTLVPQVLSWPQYSDDRLAVRMDVMLGAAREYSMRIDASCHPGLVTPQGQPLLGCWLAFRTADHRGRGEFVRPVVVRTDPPMGSTTVDPKRTTLELEFSTALQNSPLRLDRDRGTFPERIGAPRLDRTRRRCTVGVRLKPGTVYVLGVNVRQPKTFYSAAGRPGVPFLWAFATRRPPTQTDAIPYPRIVAIEPRHGASDVAASIKQLRVTFGEPMQPGYSVVGHGASCPSPIGRPVWSPDRRTITWTVRLQRHTRYRFSLNSRWYRNFRSERGIPCRPTVVEFKTGN